jgi:hypothetical protein
VCNHYNSGNKIFPEKLGGKIPMIENIFLPKHSGNAHEIEKKDFEYNSSIGNVEQAIGEESADYKSEAYQENQKLKGRAPDLYFCPNTVSSSCVLFRCVGTHLLPFWV